MQTLQLKEGVEMTEEQEKYGDDSFEGFDEPVENWSKLPHQFIDMLPSITSFGEIKVLIYTLRHTWGFHESEKRISLDEYQYGRKTKGGGRMDCGTGLSRPTIIAGISAAVKHGYLLVREDNRDLARKKRFYTLRIKTGVKKVYRRSKESLPRT